MLLRCECSDTRRDKWFSLRVTDAEQHYLRRLGAANPTDFILWAVQVAMVAWCWAADGNPMQSELLRALAVRRPGRVALGEPDRQP